MHGVLRSFWRFGSVVGTGELIALHRAGDHRLAAVADVHVLHHQGLTARGLQPVQRESRALGRLHQAGAGSEQAHGLCAKKGELQVVLLMPDQSAHAHADQLHGRGVAGGDLVRQHLLDTVIRVCALRSVEGQRQNASPLRQAEASAAGVDGQQVWRGARLVDVPPNLIDRHHHLSTAAHGTVGSGQLRRVEQCEGIGFKLICLGQQVQLLLGRLGAGEHAALLGLLQLPDRGL